MWCRMSTFLKEIKQWLASSSFIGCIEWSNDKMFSSYFIEHFYGLPVYFLGFDFFLLYLCIVFSNNAIRRQEKFTPTKKYISGIAAIAAQLYGGCHKYLWRSPQLFMTLVINPIQLTDFPFSVDTLSFFYWHILLLRMSIIYSCVPLFFHSSAANIGSNS